MKYLRICLALALVFAFTISLVHGMNPESEYCTTDPEDGSGLPECYTPDDNECYVGGDMENRCLTDYDWIVGWYLARYNDGIFEREDIPEAYRPPSPHEDAANSSGSNGVCLNISVNRYVLKSSLKALGSSISTVGLFSDSDCTTKSVNYALFIQADSGVADTTCNNYYSPNGYSDDYSSVYPNLRRCFAG